MQDRMEIERKVAQLAAEVLQRATVPSLTAHLVRDLGADSLDMVDLMMVLEREFGISISDDELSQTATVGDAVALVERKRRMRAVASA